MIIKNRVLILFIGWFILIGILTFLSASITYLKDPGEFKRIFLIQVLAIILGVFSILYIQKNKLINYKTIKNNSFYLFIFSIILQLLVFIPGIGITLNGANRWIHFGPLTLQPSELLRFSAILFFANFFFIFQKEIKNFNWIFWKILTPIFLIFAIFYYSIHDLGSYIILVISIFSILLFTKIDKIRLIFYSILALILMLLAAWMFSDHARARINTFLYPEKRDIAGDYYQNYNMLKAVGSGQIIGVGYGNSMQKFNGSIPEAISDSIFSIYAEEWGFIGSVILVLSYLIFSILIFIRLLKIKNQYQKMVVVGLTVNLFFPAFYNIASALSLVPLSGVPLTFISKGGTSILISLISLGIILLFIKK